MSTRSNLQSAPTAAGSVSANLVAAGSSLELGRQRKQTSSSLSKQPRQLASGKQLKLSSLGISSDLEGPSYPAVSAPGVVLSTDTSPVIKASSIVFARFRSDTFRVAKILNTDRIRGRCYMRFEDDLTHWCRFYELQQNIYAGEGCCLCGQRVVGVPDVSEYISCTKCQMGFHRKCHNPPVSADQTGENDLDWLCRVCYYKKTGEKHDIFIKKRSSSASGSSTNLSDGSTTDIGSLSKVHKDDRANGSPGTKVKTIGKELVQSHATQSKSVSDVCLGSQRQMQIHKTGNSKGKISRPEAKFKKRKKDSNETTTGDGIVVGASDSEHRNSIGSASTSSSPSLHIVSSKGDRTFPTINKKVSKPRNRNSIGTANIDEIDTATLNSGKQKSADETLCDTDVSLSKSSSLESLVCLDDVIYGGGLNSIGRFQSVPRQSYVTELSSSDEFSDLESEGSESDSEMDLLKEKFLNRAESAGSTPCRPTSDQGTISTVVPLLNVLRSSDSVCRSKRQYAASTSSTVEPAIDAEVCVTNRNITEQVQTLCDLSPVCSVNPVKSARKRGRPPLSSRPESWYRKGSVQGRSPSKKPNNLLTKSAGNLKACVASSERFTDKASKKSSIKLLENGEGSRRILRSVVNPFDRTTAGGSVAFNSRERVGHADLSSECRSPDRTQAESMQQCDRGLVGVEHCEKRLIPVLLQLHEQSNQQPPQEQKQRQQCEDSSGLTIIDSPINVSRSSNRSSLDHSEDQVLENEADSLLDRLPCLIPIVSTKHSHKNVFRGPYRTNKILQRHSGSNNNKSISAAASRSIPLGSKFGSKDRILGKNPRGRPKLKNNVVRQSQRKLLNDRSRDRKVSASDVIASLTHPRNAVDKSVIETACKENTDKERLAAAMVDYFGTKSRLLDGAACRIVGLRVGETGALEYLVEWENGVVV